MPMLKNWRFGGPSNPLPSPIQDAQRSINLYPEIGIDGSKSRIGMTGTPGLNLFATLPHSPVRALWFDGTNYLYAVGGTHVYKINPQTGAIITDYGAIPGSTATGFAQILYDNNSGAGHLLVCDPSVPGGSIVRVDTMATVWTASYADYIDGFIIAVTTGANQSVINQVNSSNLLDGTTWNALNYVQRTGASDLVVAVVQINSTLWIFGYRTTEVWYDAGNLGFPLARMQGALINVGCAFPASIAKLDNSLFWLGMDDRNWGRVYRSNGMSAVPISTAAIELLIQNGLSSGVAAAAAPRGWTYSEAGHIFYVLSFNTGGLPGYGRTPPNGTGFTIAYDLTTGEWHERGYYFGAPHVGLGRILQDCSATVQPGIAAASQSVYVGDAFSGNIYTQNLIYTSDNGNVIERVRVAPAIPTQNCFMKFRRFELDADIGTAVPVVDYSDDGGRTFQTTLARNLAKSAAAGVDTFGRYYGLQWGRSRDRRWRVTILDGSNPINLIDAYIDAEEGIEEAA